MQLPLLDVVVLIVYVLGSVAFGCWFVVRSRDPEGFTSAKGRIPSLVVALSLFGTYISSISFLGYAGMAYIGNWNTFTLSLTLPLVAWIGAKWFVPFYRNCGTVSTYCHLEERFGLWCRLYATVCYLLTQIARMGTVMFLLAIPLRHLLGWDMVTIILVTGLLTTFYSTLGGIEGVVWTDAFQSAVLICATVLCVVLIPFLLPEGPGQLFKIALENKKFSLGTLSSDLSQSTFWVVLIYGITINLQNFGIDQNFVQRYLTARSEQDAKKSLWISCLTTIPMNACFFFIGTALFAYYTVRPELLSPELTQEIAKGNGDGVFPYFIVHGLPTGITGLVIAALFAAAMSTISTSLNGCATLTLTDFYRRFWRPQASAKEEMVVLYSTTVLWGVLGMAAAIAMLHAKNILDVWWTISGIVSGGMLGLFLLGFLSRKSSNTAALLGTLAGIAVILWMTLSLPALNFWPESLVAYGSPFHRFLIPVVGTVTILLVGFLATLVVPQRRASEPLNDN
ncbi:MAG: sodium:solute symporter [Planctomycetia bacterium]|nr:sodium:solute symporter [Planctomycetia bacterium]